mgnify:FL=1
MTNSIVPCHWSCSTVHSSTSVTSSSLIDSESLASSYLSPWRGQLWKMQDHHDPIQVVIDCTPGVLTLGILSSLPSDPIVLDKVVHLFLMRVLWSLLLKQRSLSPVMHWSQLRAGETIAGKGCVSRPPAMHRHAPTVCQVTTSSTSYRIISTRGSARFFLSGGGEYLRANKYSSKVVRSSSSISVSRKSAH